MKLKFLMLIFSFLILTACGVTKPVATTHTERIEQHVMPVAVGADTIIIESVFSAGEPTVLSRRAKNATASSVSSVRNTNSEGVKSVSICRATSCAARERIEEKEELKSELSVQSVGDEKSRSEKKSVHSVYSVREKENSVRNKNSVRISSTRGVNITRHETDTSTRIKLTLQPDTVFVPYTNHIRSDTIVVPDRVCQQKLNRSNMTNLFLILILIAMLMLAVRRAKLV